MSSAWARFGAGAGRADGLDHCITGAEWGEGRDGGENGMKKKRGDEGEKRGEGGMEGKWHEEEKKRGREGWIV